MWENDRSVWNVIWYFEASGVEESCQFSFPITRSCSQSHWLRRFAQPPKWKRFRNFAKKDVALARFIVPISGSNSRARNKHALQLIVIENLFWLLWTSCRICISGQIDKSLYCEEAMVNVNERVWAEFNEALRNTNIKITKSQRSLKLLKTIGKKSVETMLYASIHYAWCRVVFVFCMVRCYP